MIAASDDADLTLNARDAELNSRSPFALHRQCSWQCIFADTQLKMKQRRELSWWRRFRGILRNTDILPRLRPRAAIFTIEAQLAALSIILPLPRQHTESDNKLHALWFIAFTHAYDVTSFYLHFLCQRHYCAQAPIITISLMLSRHYYFAFIIHKRNNTSATTTTIRLDIDMMLPRFRNTRDYSLSFWWFRTAVLII